MTEPAHSSQIQAPFTDQQVEGLNWYQHHAPMHPFTCGKRDIGHPPEAVLRATNEGWVCDHCTYTQAWAWEWMTDPANFPSLF